MNRIHQLLLASTFVAGFASPALAAPPAAPAKPVPAKAVAKAEAISGTIVSYSTKDRTLVLQTEKAQARLMIEKETKLMQDGKPIDATAIKVGSKLSGSVVHRGQHRVLENATLTS